MKKLTLKLDKDAILEFLLQNVEKIVLGIVVLIFLSMVYFAATKSGRFDKTPEQLQSEAANGQRAIDATPADSGLAGLAGKDRDYVAEASRNRDPIRENWYGIALWDAPLFEQRPLRDKPPLFPVEDLRAAAGMGAFRAGATAPQAGADAVAAGPTRGQRWVVLTGLVPLEKQEAAYAEVLKQSVFFDPQKDDPDYPGYWVQRVEVNNSGDAANPDWDKAPPIISRTAIEQAEGQWSSSSKDADVVDPKFIIPNLAFPLGPLEGEHWDASVAHAPEIVLEKKDKSGSPVDGRSPGAGKGQEASSDGHNRAPGGESDPFGGEKPKPEAVAKTAAPADNNAPAESKDLGFRLFRFFDFNVEPGKQYIYRVRLALRNPNYLQKAAVLKKAESGQRNILVHEMVRSHPYRLRAARHAGPGQCRQTGAGQRRADRPNYRGQVADSQRSESHPRVPGNPGPGGQFCRGLSSRGRRSGELLQRYHGHRPSRRRTPRSKNERADCRRRNAADGSRRFLERAQ